MLLLTDDPIDGLRLKQILELYQPCAVLPVVNTPRKVATHWLITCRLSHFDSVIKNHVKTALDHYRFDIAVPVIFIIDKPDEISSGYAKDLGATAIISRDASNESFISTFKSCRDAYIDSRYANAPAVGKRSSVSVEQVGSTISDLFQSVANRQEVSVDRLEEGADNLIKSIKKTELKEWINIVRLYDDATYQHCLLVAGLVASFSIRLGLSHASQHWISQAAMIHDIGKIRVPLNIINKPGPLTDQERAIVDQHPIEGYRILEKNKRISPRILDVVLHHHELIDGSGYPDKLSKKQISEAVRITTICDICAALVERRPYKKPMTIQQALDTIYGMGSKLDSGLVSAFAGNVRSLDL